jgi:hypothetical protein
MMRIAIAVLERLLVSVAVLVILIAVGALYGHFVGPSKIAYAGSVMLIAWPWALPQVFIVVSIVWYVTQRIKSARHHGSHTAS